MNEYFLQAAETYSIKSSSGLWGYLKRREVNSLFSALESVENKKIIDLGCGIGTYGKHALSLGAKQVLFVDACAPMLQQIEKSEKVNIYCGSILDLPSEPAETIICAGALEFNSSFSPILTKAIECMAPNAELGLLLPVGSWKGFLYKTWHNAKQCPTYLHSKSDVCHWLTNRGLRLKRAQSSFIADVLVFSYSRPQ